MGALRERERGRERASHNISICNTNDGCGEDTWKREGEGGGRAARGLAYMTSAQKGGGGQETQQICGQTIQDREGEGIK